MKTSMMSLRRWYKQLSDALEEVSRRGVKEELLSRIFDVCLAAILLVVLAPLMALVAVSIRLSGFEPVLFPGDRVGRHGRPFRILKFRTMTADSTIKPAKLTVDLAYVRCRTIHLDLKIVVLTVLALVCPERSLWAPNRIQLGSKSFSRDGEIIATGRRDSVGWRGEDT